MWRVLLVLLLLASSAGAGVHVSFLGGGAPGADAVAPTFQSATVNADAAVITLSEDVTVTGLANGDFVMTGSTTGAVDLNTCSELVGVISCTAASAFVNGETVTLAYTGNAPDDIEDLAGNDLEDFTGQSVTNNTPALPVNCIFYWSADSVTAQKVGGTIDGTWGGSASAAYLTAGAAHGGSGLGFDTNGNGYIQWEITAEDILDFELGTIVAYVTPQTAGSYKGWFGALGDDTSNYIGGQTDNATHWVGAYYGSGGGTNRAVTTSSTYSTSTEYLVRIAWDNPTSDVVSISIDGGAFSDSSSPLPTINHATGPFYLRIGSTAAGANMFDCFIDEVYIYSTKESP